jgi:hypothetical protein
MAYVKIHIPTELRKLAAGKRTKVSAESLLHLTLGHTLDALQAAEPEAGDAVEFLERLFSIPDTR